MLYIYPAFHDAIFCNKTLQSYTWWWSLGLVVIYLLGDGMLLCYYIVYLPNTGVLDRYGDRWHVIFCVLAGISSEQLVHKY